MEQAFQVHPPSRHCTCSGVLPAAVQLGTTPKKSWRDAGLARAPAAPPEGSDERRFVRCNPVIESAMLLKRQPGSVRLSLSARSAVMSAQGVRRTVDGCRAPLGECQEPGAMLPFTPRLRARDGLECAQAPSDCPTVWVSI